MHHICVCTNMHIYVYTYTCKHMCAHLQREIYMIKHSKRLQQMIQSTIGASLPACQSRTLRYQFTLTPVGIRCSFTSNSHMAHYRDQHRATPNDKWLKLFCVFKPLSVPRKEGWWTKSLKHAQLQDHLHMNCVHKMTWLALSHAEWMFLGKQGKVWVLFKEADPGLGSWHWSNRGLLLWELMQSNTTQATGSEEKNWAGQSIPDATDMGVLHEKAQWRYRENPSKALYTGHQQYAVWWPLSHVKKRHFRFSLWKIHPESI